MGACLILLHSESQNCIQFWLSECNRLKTGWTGICFFFFSDPKGVAVQTHHVHTYSYHDSDEFDESATHQPTKEVIEVGALL